MTNDQKRVVELIDNAEPKENLERWIRGRIPKNYKRLSIDMKEAKELAEFGARKSFKHFGTRLHFTQSLIMGAYLKRRYKRMFVVTPSQYGKSFVCAQIGILIADEGEPMYVAGGSEKTTNTIFKRVRQNIQTADAGIKNRLLEPVDKIEKMQTSLSKNRIANRNGGFLEKMSLGETFNDPLKSNDALGETGNIALDEASLIRNETYRELGRRQVARMDGDAYMSIEISNPHNPGRFWDNLTKEELAKDTLVIWMDVRTSIEEGRLKSKEQVVNLDFFEDKSTCKRYLLCELEDYSEESLFGEPVIDDSPLQDDYDYFLGVDSAYKGKDKIKVVLNARTANGVRVLASAVIHKDNWVDGVTGEEIVNDIMKIANKYKAKKMCVDVGYGIYIVEGLAKRQAPVKGINFSEGTTDFRKKAGHYSARWGDNKRAEMHIDLQELMDGNKITFTSEMAEELKEEMNAVRAVRRASGGKTGIIPKDDIKRIIGHSPDALDATLLGIHALLLHSMSEKVFLYQDE